MQYCCSQQDEMGCQQRETGRGTLLLLGISQRATSCPAKGRRGLDALLELRGKRPILPNPHYCTISQPLSRHRSPSHKRVQTGINDCLNPACEGISILNSCHPSSSHTLLSPRCGAALQGRVPELTICWLLEVYVGIAQRSARGHVPAHPDGQDGPRR